MATVDELLSTLDTDKTLIIDKDLRTIIIPSSVKNLGVESDDDVLRLKFSMPRMYGDVDLSDFSIYINYMNAKNTGDVYVVDDKTIADDTITFSWLVGRVALAYKGNVRFIVCMKKHDNDSNVIQEYNTTIASLPVLEGLETGETVIQQNPDIIEMLLTSLEPLVGTTRNITPSRVLAAIKAGRDVALQYTDSYYGAFVFSAFNANERLGIVVSNSILPQMNGLTGTLLGFVEDDAWDFKATNTATKDDVGTAVNEALTAAKASGEFDGADGITPTIGENGNWFLGNTDTNKPSRGKSAYSYAQEGGYTGTEAEFAAKLAAKKLPNPYPLTFTGAVNETYDGSSAKTIEIPSGGGGAASGLGIYDNYDVALISFAQIDQATLPIDAGIVITADDNGNSFSYDGVVVWTDIKSGASYTDIDFNNVPNVHYPIQHGVKDGMNMYVVDGTSMRAIVGYKSCVYIRQTRDDVNAAFYPASNIEQLPEKITAIHLCPRNKVVTGTFYKIWGLTKK